MRSVFLIAVTSILILAVTAPAIAEPAKPESYLEPERSQYGGDLFMSGYDDLVLSVLKEAFAQDVAVRMVAVPSFVPEFAVGLKGTPGNYRVFSLRPKVQLWGYETLRMMKDGSLRTVVGDAQKQLSDLQSTLPADPRAVPVISCQTSINTQLGGRIATVWEKMLRKTRFPPPSAMMGVDGADYHFSMRSNLQYLAGRTWSPDQNSATGLLVGIGMAMNDYCAKKGGGSSMHLEQQLAQLEKRLSLTQTERPSPTLFDKMRNWYRGWRQAH
ncbi:hypothetical protein AYO42_00870 [Rhizomicrobium sp. SCGC AG-212-E05]|nr:hypothetical protein AYO42_00870 [Rhizomicrobium sp. SCGC AG-212-E05]